MTDENTKEETSPAITQSTPVSQEDLSQLEHLMRVRTQLSQEAMDIDLKKVQILATVRRIDQQKNELFNRILTERGFAPGTVIEIDPKTGEFTVSEEPS